MQLMEYPVDEAFQSRPRPDIEAIISTTPAADASAVYEEALVKPQVKIAELNRESALVGSRYCKRGFFLPYQPAGMSLACPQAAEMGSQLKCGYFVGWIISFDTDFEITRTRLRLPEREARHHICRTR